MQSHLASPAVKTLLILSSLVIVLAGVKAASNILVPFILSAFLAIVLSPAIHTLERFRLPKVLAISVVLLILVSLGMMLGALVGQSVSDFSRDLPKYQDALREDFVWLVELATKYNMPIDKEQLLQLFDPGKVVNFASNLVAGLGGVMANFLLILLTVVFMLFEAPYVNEKIHMALHDPDMKQKQIDRFLDSVNSYLAIKTGVSLATGVVVSISLWILGVDYFLLWGVCAFLLNYIPNIGSIIAAIPPVLLALVVDGPAIAAMVGAVFIVVNTVMGNVIEPRFMGRGLGLSTLVVFLSLIFWGWLLGSVGMLLSVPLTMIVKIALESREESRWLAILLSSDDDVKPTAKAHEAES